MWNRWRFEICFSPVTVAFSNLIERLVGLFGFTVDLLAGDPGD